MSQVICRETGKNPTLAVIWLHGLGADGNDFVPIVPELKLPADCAVRFLFPTASSIPVTINGGFVMPAWYDILSLDGDQRQVDEAGIIKSRELVRQLIAEQNAAGIPSHRIVIAGFSQGGAIAWTTALTHPEPLAGIIALSTYLPSLALIQRDLNAANVKLPMLAAHGSHDDVVPMSMGLQARTTVEALGGQVEWQQYPMAHAVCLEEIRHIGQWLAQRCRESS
ncbi:MAG: alpha/beta hydrolase [Moraxellaceae bacterium]|nr:alpha/beta hydrolase [Moraxellaceae bacterium]MDP1776835.1 alpha/beta hydrolase [Moraxellaceae bacterium]